MKKAQHFFDQMTPEEKEKYIKQFKFQHPSKSLIEWLNQNEFKSFEQFLDK